MRFVGVLRLIHQDMVDLLVEFKPHPLRHLAMLQKLGSAPYHIVEIYRADGMFGAAILRRKFLADAQCARQPVGILRTCHFAQ